MKNTKLISGILLVVMAVSMTACKGKAKIKETDLIGNPDTTSSTEFFMHSKDEKEQIFHNCYITDTMPIITDLPLVGGSQNTLYCPTIGNKTLNPEDYTAYVFDHNDEYKWNTAEAYAAIKGTSNTSYKYQMGGDIFAEPIEGNSILFKGDLPDGMKPGVYTVVIVDKDEGIRGIKDCDLVATVKIRNEYKENHYVDKPVIYLYPEEQTDVNVSLDLDFDLTCTYPKYNDGWNVTAFPDGHMVNKADGRSYDYLFWEGQTADGFWNFDKAACVKGEDTVAFLEAYLTAAGLNDSEIDDFISFWLPKMEGNAYNLISFPTKEYSEAARLNVSPAPDTEIRVYMVFEALDSEIEIAEGHELQMPETPSRDGFTVVEWGGTEIR